MSIYTPTLSFTGARWTEAPIPALAPAELQTRLGISATVARCLTRRLPHTPDDASGWMKPDLDQLHDPFAMRGMAEAVDRLRRAARDRQRLRVVTDYDVDGTTSSLILQAGLKMASPDASDFLIDYHIPDRFLEGYGFSVAAAQKAAADGIDLIITADIGVRDHAAVAAARNAGIEVLICDHHLPGGAEVPSDATVLCPPQTGCAYPNRHLAACGISLKLAQALLAGNPRKELLLRSFLKLAAIGTVADLVPLTTLENRAIVALGLQELNRGPHTPGLAALLEASGLKDGPIRESDLGYRIGPRINAAGRVADARMVVDLLTCRDADRARDLARRIDRLNDERRDIQKHLVDEALDKLRSSPEPDPFVVLSGPEHEGWHRGVVGIVASRIKDEVNRPVAIVSIQGDRAVGSVRSIPGVHAVHALESCSDLLEKFGGHPVAAGFTVPTRHLERLQERLNNYVREHTSEDVFAVVHEFEGEVVSHELTDRLWGELESLAPFGQGNPRPRLMIRNVRPQAMISRPEKGLLKFVIPGSSTPVEAVWWQHTHLAEALSAGPVDLLGELQENRWKGSRTLQFQIADARPTV